MQKQSSDRLTFSVLAALGTLALLGVLIVLLVSLGNLIIRNMGGTTRVLENKVVERVKPVGRLNDGIIVKVEQKKETAKEIVDRLCSTCHNTGLNGAPVMGNNTEWLTRYNERGGFEGLKKSVLNGYNNGLMPAKGGDPSLSDDEAVGAMIYQLKASGLEESLKEANVNTDV